MEQYKLPKHILEKEEEDPNAIHEAGQAYKGQELENEFSLQKGHDLFAPPPSKKELEKVAKRKRKEERQRKREEREERRRDREHKRKKKSKR